MIKQLRKFGCLPKMASVRIDRGEKIVADATKGVGLAFIPLYFMATDPGQSN